MCSLLVMSGCGNGLVVLYRLKGFGQSCLAHVDRILRTPLNSNWLP